MTRSCRLDWESPFFTAPVARPIVVTVAGAGLLDELCLSLSPRLVGGDAKRILDGLPVPGPASLRLCSVCEQDRFLFLRYRPGPGR